MVLLIFSSDFMGIALRRCQSLPEESGNTALLSCFYLLLMVSPLRVSRNFGRSQTASGRLRRKLPFLSWLRDIPSPVMHKHVQTKWYHTIPQNQTKTWDYLTQPESNKEVCLILLVDCIRLLRKFAKVQIKITEFCQHADLRRDRRKAVADQAQGLQLLTPADLRRKFRQIAGPGGSTLDVLCITVRTGLLQDSYMLLKRPDSRSSSMPAKWKSATGTGARASKGQEGMFLDPKVWKIVWNSLEQSGTVWNSLEQSGIVWNRHSNMKIDWKTSANQERCCYIISVEWVQEVAECRDVASAALWYSHLNIIHNHSTGRRKTYDRLAEETCKLVKMTKHQTFKPLH